MEKTMKVLAELTDTYGGEANYSWVRRVELEVPDTLSDRAIVRRAKKAVGVEGVRATRRENYGDHIWLWGLGGCTALFISIEH